MADTTAAEVARRIEVPPDTLRRSPAVDATPDDARVIETEAAR
jgi:hypothetical protein